METIYSNGLWVGVYSDFDYLTDDGEGNTIICNQVDAGECVVVELSDDDFPPSPEQKCFVL